MLPKKKVEHAATENGSLGPFTSSWVTKKPDRAKKYYNTLIKKKGSSYYKINIINQKKP